jgi:type IV fimbrial biogenesis protein FimT
MRKNGFTLIEMMVTLTLAGILAGIAIPNMRTFLWNNRIASSGNDLLHSIGVARTEAIKRQQVAPGLVSVCSTTNSSAADNAIACTYGNFSQWFVFVDTNGNGQHDNGEDVLDRGAAATTNTVKSNQNGIICYGPTGFTGLACGGGRVPTTAVALCDSRGNVAVGTNSTARALFISQTGRARISQLYADVNTALTTIGGTCP